MLTGAACALAGADTILAFGCSDGAQSLSLAKVLLDCDSVGALRRLVREDPIDATRALLDDIAAVGPAATTWGARARGGSTAAARSGSPALWQRGPFEAYEGRPLVAEAAARAEELLRTHEVEPLADDVAAEVDAVIERYARSVGAPTGRVELEGSDRMSATWRGEVVVGPLEDLAAMRRLGVACGLEDDGRDDDGIARGLGRPRRRRSRRRHRTRALREHGYGELARRGRALPAPRHRRGALRRAGARGAGARHAPALGDRARAGVLRRAGVRARGARRPSATHCSAGVWSAGSSGASASPGP